MFDGARTCSCYAIFEICVAPSRKRSGMEINMTIGAISFQPYVYTVNSISAASMNRLSKISDDVLDKKIDYSELAEAKNENPLKKGQTLDFQGMLEMQMNRGRNNASRIMKSVKETAQAEEMTAQEGNTVQAAMTRQADNMARTEAVPAENLQTAAMAMGSGDTGIDISNFRMQQAISAYEMFMTA